MKIRLKVLCWLFAVAYLFVILHVLVSEFVPEIVSGWEDGMEEGRRKHENRGEEGKEHAFNFAEKLYVKVVPVKGGESYPDRILNEKTGKEILAKSRIMYLRVTDMPQLPWYLVAGNIGILILSFATIFILIHIPILSFKTIKSVVRDDIFDVKNIRRIRKIGYYLMVVFLFGLFYAITSEATAQYLVSMKEYKIVFPLGSEDIFILVLSILVLIFAEVLKVATEIKEEQDFTI